MTVAEAFDQDLAVGDAAGPRRWSLNLRAAFRLSPGTVGAGRKVEGWGMERGLEECVDGGRFS